MNKPQKKLTIWFVAVMAVWIMLSELMPFFGLTGNDSPARDEFISSIRMSSK